MAKATVVVCPKPNGTWPPTVNRKACGTPTTPSRATGNGQGR